MAFAGLQCNQACHTVIIWQLRPGQLSGGVSQQDMGALKGGRLSQNHVSNCVRGAVGGAESSCK